MSSPTWSIKGGEKKNPEAVAISRRIQEIWKPGEGRIGIAFNFIDAQVSFSMTGFISIILIFFCFDLITEGSFTQDFFLKILKIFYN